VAPADDDERDADADLARLLKQAGHGPTPSDQQLGRWRASARREWRRAVRWRRLRLAAVPFGLLAAAALVVALIDRRSLPRSGHDPVPAPPPAVADTLHVVGDVREHMPGGAPDGIRLRDGDHVRPGALVATRNGRATLGWYGGLQIRLDQATRIHVQRERVVLETGAVYVDTERAREAPFAVVTVMGSARHRGTRYEVRLQGGMLRVRVRQGAVELERAAGAQTAAAGEELSVDTGGNLVRRAVDTYGPAWSWVAEAGPAFRLEGRSAREFLEWAAGEGGWSIRFADAATSAFATRTKVHGTIEGLSPAGALAVVLPTCGLDHELRGGDLFVRKAVAR
jgi:hypothetical protein